MADAPTASKLSLLDKLAQRIDDISTLPQVAIRIVQVANDPDAGVVEFKEVMESDAALSARILRVVNSSAYALRSRITNLQQAISYLGLKQIRNLALTASVSDLFRQGQPMGTYRREGLWRHLVTVGLCARLVALRRKLSNFEDAFVAGLLHDIGIIMMDQHAHTPFCQVIERLDGSKTLCEVERGLFGFDHTMLGERVAQSWRFPEMICDAIRYHHTSVSYRGEHIDLIRCVEVANIITTVKDITSVGVKLVRNSPPALTGLALTGPDLVVLGEDLDQEVRTHTRLFKM